MISIQIAAPWSSHFSEAIMSQPKQSSDEWFTAAKTGNLQYIQDNCIKCAGKYSKNGLTALQTAAYYNQPKVVQILAQYEARMRSSKELTGLMIAGMKDYVEVVRILAPLESRIVSNNSTAIIQAARHGSKASVEVLLQYEYFWIGQACQSAHISGQFEVANFLQEQIQFPQYIGSITEQNSTQQVSGSIGIQDLDNSSQSALLSQLQGSNATRTTINSQIVENDNVTKYFKFTETIKELETKLQDQIRTCAANQQQNISYISKLKEQEAILQKTMTQCSSKEVQIQELQLQIKSLKNQIKQLIKDNNELDTKLYNQQLEQEKQYKKQCYEQDQQKSKQQRQNDTIKKHEKTIQRLEIENARLKDDVCRYSLKAAQLEVASQQSKQPPSQRLVNQVIEPTDLNQGTQIESQVPPERPVTLDEQDINTQSIFKVKSTNY